MSPALTTILMLVFTTIILHSRAAVSTIDNNNQLDLKSTQIDLLTENGSVIDHINVEKSANNFEIKFEQITALILSQTFSKVKSITNPSETLSFTPYSFTSPSFSDDNFNSTNLDKPNQSQNTSINSIPTTPLQHSSPQTSPLIPQQQDLFRFSFLASIHTTVNKPISRDHFFNPSHPWYWESLVNAFNDNIGIYMQSATSSTGIDSVYNVVSMWRDRQTIVSHIVMDEYAFQNAWNYVGSNVGARTLVKVVNTARADNTYEFIAVKTTSSLSYKRHCVNNVMDGDETDFNCGGACIPCTGSQLCKIGFDCSSDFCDLNLCRDLVNNAYNCYISVLSMIIITIFVIVFV
jgi:hypothetical protein